MIDLRCSYDNLSEFNRSRILNEIRNVVRDRLKLFTATYPNTHKSKNLNLGHSSHIKPIRPIKQIQIAKPFTNLEKIKKSWDPDHTGLAWKD
jgi:hypothetical protein